ncbi:MAG TPA: 50S ribosomal protein L25/general stress protein Ctc [Gemmatimonadales bacterium]
MAQAITLVAEPRSEKGKGAARQLRMRGRIPAVIYGHGRDPAKLSIAATDLEKALGGVAAESTIFELSIGGSTTQALIREIQRHPVRAKVLHLDFYEIHAGEVLTLAVPVYLVGEPDGVRNAGGVLDQVLREIEIEVLPKDIPERIEVDVTNLKVGDSLHVSDIQVPNADVLTDPEYTLCSVVPPRTEAEPVVAEEAEGVEVVEPELIRKPKAEDEEDSGAEG